MAGIDNYETKVKSDAETHPGGTGGDSMSFGDGDKLTMKKQKGKGNNPAEPGPLKSSVSGLKKN